MQLPSIREAFLDRLSMIRDAERRLISFLPHAAGSSYSADLHELLDDYSQISAENLSRIDRIFSTLKESPVETTSAGMSGLIDDAQAVIDAAGHHLVKDSVLISAARQWTHYLIAGYVSVRSWARDLDLREISDHPQKAADAQSRMDGRLGEIAVGGLLKTGLNAQAPRE